MVTQNRTNRRPTRRRKKRRLKILPKIIACGLIACLVIGLGIAIWVLTIAIGLPEWQSDQFANNETSFVYDKDGELMSKLHQAENRVLVDLDQMPTYLVDAFVATEDVRFYKHHGIDVRRVFGALKADILQGSFAEGASTITMQLARNAILDDQEKHLTRKIKEALLAVQIEQHYTKPEILYYYLNEIYFGEGGTYGVQAASKLYFDKDVQDISMSEAALLVGIIRNPKIYSPYNNMEKAINVRDTVLNNLAKYDPKYEQSAIAAKGDKIILSSNPSKGKAYSYPWFTDYVIDEATDILSSLGLNTSQLYTAGLKIYTTVDNTVQSKMEEVYASDKYFPKSKTKDLIESAMLVMDPTTGEIRGLVGGREYVTRRGFNRATDLKRQPGSTFKPVSVYAAALENGYSPASVMNDSLTTFGTNYQPKNYDGSYRGYISMRTAIMKSVNVVAVKFLQKIGVNKGYTMAESLGIPLVKEDKSLSLALGGLSEGLAPLHMAGAYSAFANQGVYIEPHAITKIEDKFGTELYQAKPQQTVAMSPETAYLLTSMMVSTTQSGTGTSAKMNRPVASKTGTTQLPDTADFQNKTGNKDAWFAAYTPELVGVVWMGYDNTKDEDGKLQYLNQIYGGKYPAQIWKTVMTAALKNAPVKEFTKPANIVEKTIDAKSGLLPSSLTPNEYLKTEVFNAKNVPTEVSDFWVQVDVDPETNMLATEFCPNRVAKVFLKNDLPNGSPKNTADKHLAVPTETCTLHTTAQANTVAVTVCNDPRNTGSYKLANIPTGKDTGGCPATCQETKYFSKTQVPTEHCKLEDHTVKTSTVIVVPDNPGGSTDPGTTTPEPDKKLGAPQKLQATLVTDGVKISWSDAYNEPNSVVYVVEQYEGGTTSPTTSVSHVKYANFSGLKSGTSYKYRVYAYNESKDLTSPWTEYVTIKIP